MSYTASVSGSHPSTSRGGNSASDSMGSEGDLSTTDTDHQTSAPSAAPDGFADGASTEVADADAPDSTEPSEFGLLAQQGATTLREMGKETTPQQQLAQGHPLTEGFHVDASGPTPDQAAALDMADRVQPRSPVAVHGDSSAKMAGQEYGDERYALALANAQVVAPGLYKHVRPDGSVVFSDKPYLPGEEATRVVPKLGPTDPNAAAERVKKMTELHRIQNEPVDVTYDSRIGGIIGRVSKNENWGHNFDTLRNGVLAASDALNTGADAWASFKADELRFDCSFKQDQCAATIEVAGSKKYLYVTQQEGKWGFAVEGSGKNGSLEFIQKDWARHFEGVLGKLEDQRTIHQGISDAWRGMKEEAQADLRQTFPTVGKSAVNKVVDYLGRAVPTFLKDGNASMSGSIGPVKLTISANVANAVENVPRALATEIVRAVKYNFQR